MPLARDPQPPFTGIATFMRAPLADVNSLKPGSLAVAGVPYDLSGRGRPGARYGPRSLREASARFASILTGMESIDCETGARISFPGGEESGIADLGDFDIYPLDWGKTKKTVKESMYRIAKTGTVPIILGGDHLITCALISGYQQAMAESGQGRIGYLRFSSQLDLGQEDPILGTVWRGTTARRILDDHTVRATNMVWVGTNGYIPKDQVDLAQELDLKIHTLKEVVNKGIGAVTLQALEEASEGCDAIYASIDMDVIDGVYIHSMSVPSFQGLKNVELQVAMNTLAQGPVKALDMVGCNPITDYIGQGQVASNFASAMVFHFMMPRFTEST